MGSCPDTDFFKVLHTFYSIIVSLCTESITKEMANTNQTPPAQLGSNVIHTIFILAKRSVSEVRAVNILTLYNLTLQGVKLIFFFADSRLAPKFFTVVGNSKKVGRHF